MRKLYDPSIKLFYFKLPNPKQIQGSILYILLLLYKNSSEEMVDSSPDTFVTHKRVENVCSIQHNKYAYEMNNSKLLEILRCFDKRRKLLNDLINLAYISEFIS
ncbi:unnamed protein product [Heterobilharzia americana]|nr:unnamed protein product [Heterobilharzia americana]CAH8603900.1 unnamed protein product [Heterobilharzia americana]